MFQVHAYDRSHGCRYSNSIHELFDYNPEKAQITSYKRKGDAPAASQLHTLPRIYFGGKLIADATSFLRSLYFAHRHPNAGPEEVVERLRFPPDNAKAARHIADAIRSLLPS